MGTIGAIEGGVTASSPAEKHSSFRNLAKVPLNLMRWLSRCIERRRTRLSLLDLTDEQLSDIGISRCDAYREGIRSFYD